MSSHTDLNSRFSDRRTLFSAPEIEVLFPARAKYVPDENGELRIASIASFSFRAFKRGGFDPRRGSGDADGVDVKRVSGDFADEYRRRASHRARVNVFDLAICNTFDLFVTLTFSPEYLDRSSYEETYNALRVWLSNLVQRHGLRYVCVPEYHADGTAIHFHMLCNSESLRLLDSCRRRGGKPVYNIPSWKWGFSTAQYIDGDHSADFVAKYTCKYMTKANGRKIGGRYYLSGGELRRPVYLFGESIEDLTPPGVTPVYEREIDGDWGNYREVSFIWPDFRRRFTAPLPFVENFVTWKVMKIETRVSGVWRWKFDFLGKSNEKYGECRWREVSNIRSCFIERRNIEKLRRVIGAFRWLPMRISLETGLRIGDVVVLRFSNVFRSNGKPVIRARAQKTGKLGVFPISESLFKQIKGLKHKGRTDFIFPSYGKTGHLTRQAAWARMKSAAADLGIDADGISPHSLRKCFAVALMHTEGLEAVKNALQHTNDAVTRIYAYSDTVLSFDSDAPIRWCDLAMLTEYIISVLNEKKIK